MAQQMVNGSKYDGSVTLTQRMSNRYAVVSDPFTGKHKKPQTKEALKKRKEHWFLRHTMQKEGLL